MFSDYDDPYADAQANGCTCEGMCPLPNPSCPIHGGTVIERRSTRRPSRSSGYEPMPYTPKPNFLDQLLKFYKRRGFLSPKQQQIFESITGESYTEFDRAHKAKRKE